MDEALYLVQVGVSEASRHHLVVVAPLLVGIVSLGVGTLVPLVRDTVLIGIKTATDGQYGGREVACQTALLESVLVDDASAVPTTFFLLAFRGGYPRNLVANG